MFNIDKHIGKPQKKEYMCWEFTRDVWWDLMRQDIGKFPKPKRFEQLENKTDPCLVLFNDRHAGVYVKGRVLHMPEGAQSRHDDLTVASLGFSRVTFYRFNESFNRK